MITASAYVTFGDLFTYTLVIITLIGIYTRPTLEKLAVISFNS